MLGLVVALCTVCREQTRAPEMEAFAA
jgi:hypothetical protein